MPPAPSIEPVVASRRPQGSQEEPPGCRCSSCSNAPARKHRGGFALERRGPSVDYLKLARTCVSFAGITMQVEAVPEQALKGPRPAGSSGTRAGCCCLTTWRFALRWQRLPAFQKPGRMLTRHLDGCGKACGRPPAPDRVAASCRRRPSVKFFNGKTRKHNTQYPNDCDPQVNGSAQAPGKCPRRENARGQMPTGSPSSPAPEHRELGRSITNFL